MPVTKLRHAVGKRIGRPRKWHLFERLPSGAVCAEVGVYKGDTSLEILRYAKPRELHLIDGWWTLQGDAYDHPWFEGERDTRAAHRQVEAIAAEYPACRIHVGDDLKVLPAFPDAYFDWVYLDSSHEYEDTVKELAVLARKVKPGGFIAGHDWRPDPTAEWHGVYLAVTEFCERENWRVVWTDDWTQWAISSTQSLSR